MRTIGVALIGTGFIGGLHARAYRSIPYLFPELGIKPELITVADVDGDRANRFAAAWDVKRYTTDWRSAVSDLAVELVDICATPNVHREIGLAAIANGKHVYCEKPVGLGSKETSELLDAAQAARVTTCVGFNYRCIPAVTLAKQMVAAGEIGEVRQVEITFNSDFSAYPDAPWDWRYSAASAGFGSLADVGSHVFDMARFIVGELTDVCGVTALFIPKRMDKGQTRAVDNDDSWAAVGRFASGALGAFQGSRVASGSKVDFFVSVVGSTGALRWNLAHMNELSVYQRRPDALDGFTVVRMGPEHPLHGDFSAVRGLGVGFADSKTSEVKGLLEAIRDGRPATPNFADALAVARILEAASKSSWTQLTEAGAQKAGRS